MIVSNKQISIAIIVLFFAGILGYFLFWFGYVEIFINHAEVESFQIKTREKIYKCDKNPCQIKIRAGQRFVGQVVHDLAENKNISISSIPLLKTEKIIIQSKEELPMAKAEKIPRSFLNLDLEKFFNGKSSNLVSFGPVLADQKGKFVVFAKKFEEGINIFIKNNNSEQLLTTIKDDFSPIFLEKNFSLTNNGMVIPAKNRVYYYDFATQRKFKLLEMNSLRMANVSVSNFAEEVIFYNIREKSWQKYDRIKDELVKYTGRTNFAGFWGNLKLEVKGGMIYLNNKKISQIPVKISESDQFSIRGDSLILEQDFDIWKIKIGSR